MPTVQFRLVDAFATEPMTGNPAGVVLDADGLDAGQMQRIAREINASETAFIDRANDLHRPTQIRWFSPTCEVKFCGHATLAAVHALAEAGEVETTMAQTRAQVVFDSAAGPLSLACEAQDAAGEQPVWWLELPTPKLTPEKGNPMRLCEHLGLTLDDLEPGAAPMRTQDGDVLLLVTSWQRLFDLRPNMYELARWSEKHEIRGICVSTTRTLSRGAHVHSRFFAPGHGIAEDPVTGSVHGPLCALLADRGRVQFTHGQAALNCLQGEPAGRTGMVRALVEQTPKGYRVQIAGQCFTTLVGELTVPSVKPSTID